MKELLPCLLEAVRVRLKEQKEKLVGLFAIVYNDIDLDRGRQRSITDLRGVL